MAVDVLDLEMRRRLFALVRAYPGIHVREAARQLGTSLALVEYHLAVLRESGLVKEEREERYVRLHPAQGGARAPQRRILTALRGRLALRVTLFLLDQDGPVRHKQVCDGLDLGKSKLSFHLRKLEAAGVVRKTPEGLFEVADRAGVLRLLLENQPTPDLRREFAELWLKLYGG